MKEALVGQGTKVKIVDSPLPVPGPEQVLIKVVVSGSNPKDWKYSGSNEKPFNTGDDIAGVIHSVGSDVTEFKPGDRVAAFHQMKAPNGSYAEYAISYAHTAFHIPHKTTFEEAATIPLAAMTAAIALYQRLGLPLPWYPATKPTPLIINGAASAIGSFGIQLAIQSNIHPLICIAGKSVAHVESLIDKSKGDVVLDYRVGKSELAQALSAAVQKAGGKAEYAFDCVSEEDSHVRLSDALAEKTGKVAVVIPGRDYSDVHNNVNPLVVWVGDAQQETEWFPVNKDTGTSVTNEDFAFAFFRYFGRGLHKGYFKGHPYEVVPRGLNGLEKGLTDLKEGKANAVKFVFRLEETEGVK